MRPLPEHLKMAQIIVTAKYSYEYKNASGFKSHMEPGDIFTLIKKANNDWWYVRKEGDKPVYLPATYLQEQELTSPELYQSAQPESSAAQTAPASGSLDRRNEQSGHHGNHNTMMQEINKRFNRTSVGNVDGALEDRGSKERARERPSNLDVQVPAPMDSRERLPSPSPFSDTSSPLFTPSRENSWNSVGGGSGGGGGGGDGVIKNPAAARNNWVTRQTPDNSYQPGGYDLPQAIPRVQQKPHLSQGGSTPHSPTTATPPPTQGDQNVPLGWRVEQTITGDPVFINEGTSEKWYKATQSNGEPYYYSEDRKKTVWALPEAVRASVYDPPISSFGNDSGVKEKEGMLTLVPLKDRGRAKKSRPGHAVLAGSQLKYYKDFKHFDKDNLNPEYSINMWKVDVVWVKNQKKKILFELNADQGSFLVQGEDEASSNEWFEIIGSAVMGQGRPWNTGLGPNFDLESPSKPSPSDAAGMKKNNIQNYLRSFIMRRPVKEDLKKKGILKEENVFGKKMTQLCQEENSLVPHFVLKCIKHIDQYGLKHEGIYRVNGNLAQVQNLRFQIDQEKPVDFGSSPWKDDIYVITGALKLYFRELPEPLFNFATFDRFIVTMTQIHDREKRIAAFKQLFDEMPKANQHTIVHLFSHLRRVIDNVDYNRMSAKNLATVFGPTLMWPERDNMNMAMLTVYQNQVMEFGIIEFDNIFPKKYFSSPDHS